MAQPLNNREERSLIKSEPSQVGAYLYMLLRGQFIIHHGDIFDSKWTDYRLFRTDKSKQYSCFCRPAEVYNNGLWLPYRDDELAAELFIKYEKEAIIELQKKVRDRHLKIAIISGGVYDETPQDHCC